MVSKPTEPVERARQKLITIIPFPGNETQIAQFAADHTAAEVERELAAYRERLRAKVAALSPLEGESGHIWRADVLELIGEMK